MGAMGIWQWVIVLAIVLIVFGKGKIPGLLGDLGKGIRSFKNGVADEPSNTIEQADSDKGEGASHA